MTGGNSTRLPAWYVHARRNGGRSASWTARVRVPSKPYSGQEMLRGSGVAFCSVVTNSVDEPRMSFSPCSRWRTIAVTAPARTTASTARPFSRRRIAAERYSARGYDPRLHGVQPRVAVEEQAHPVPAHEHVVPVAEAQQNVPAACFDTHHLVGEAAGVGNAVDPRGSAGDRPAGADLPENPPARRGDAVEDAVVRPEEDAAAPRRR